MVRRVWKPFKEYAQVTVKRDIPCCLGVLAIVSLEQPVTKIQIDIKRGLIQGCYKCSIRRGLIAIAGQVDRPGKPFLYQLTEKFFEVFGLEDQEALQQFSNYCQSEVANEVE